MIEKLVKDIDNIDKNKYITQKFKNNLYKKKSIIFKKNIKKLNISLNSYITYISRARKQFSNKKHHSFIRKFNYLNKKFTFFKKEIKKIFIKNNTYKIYIKIKYLKNKLNQINFLLKNIKKIKIINSKKKILI